MFPVLKPVSRQMATLLGLSAIVLWSSTIALIRSISEQMGTYTGATAIFSVGALVFLPAFFNFKSILLMLSFNVWRKDLGRSSLAADRAMKGAQREVISKPYLWGCGILFVWYEISLCLSVGFASDRSQVLEIGLINYLWPTLTILFSLPILRKRARGLLLLGGSTMALAGIFLVITDGSEVSLSSLLKHIQTKPLAYCLGLSAAFSWALYSNVAALFGKGQGRGAVPLFMIATAGTLMGLRLFHPESSVASFAVFWEVIFLGVVTALGYLFWDVSMRMGDMLLVASASYGTPILSSLISSFYLGVFRSGQFWAGCLLVVIGAVLSRVSIKNS